MEWRARLLSTLIVCLVVNEGKRKEENREREREGKDKKRKCFLFTCLERVREDKRKEKNVFNLDISFYLNTQNKNQRVCFGYGQN